MKLRIHDREKEELRLRVDDLIMTCARLNMIRPKLYYKILPHLTAFREELRPSWKRWFKE